MLPRGSAYNENVRQSAGTANVLQWYCSGALVFLVVDQKEDSMSAAHDGLVVVVGRGSNCWFPAAGFVGAVRPRIFGPCFLTFGRYSLPVLDLVFSVKALHRFLFFYFVLKPTLERVQRHRYNCACSRTPARYGCRSYSFWNVDSIIRYGFLAHPQTSCGRW